MSSILVHPKDFRHGIVEDLQRYEFDQEKTKLDRLSQTIQTIRPDKDECFYLRTHVAASYPSRMDCLCYNLLPALLRIFTCCWCWCKLGLKRGLSERQQQTGAEEIPDMGHSKHTSNTGSAAYMPLEGAWEKAKEPIGESEWYASLGGMDLQPLISFRNTDGKRRPDYDGNDNHDSILVLSSEPSPKIWRGICCIDLCEKCGTPEWGDACGFCFMVWFMIIMLFPFLILLFCWDIIGLPLFCIVGLLFAILCFEPFGCLQGCACGMKSSRGAALFVTLRCKYYSPSYGRDSGSTLIDKAVAEVVLAEHISVFKACFLEAGGTYPRLSRRQYLVRNPVWGMFEPGVPTEEIATAWTELIERVGGKCPNADCSRDQWDNGNFK